MGRSLKFKRVAHNWLLIALAHIYGRAVDRFGKPELCSDGPLTGLA